MRDAAALAELRRLVRIRIYGIGGIFRISIRPACAFRITENLANPNWDECLPDEDEPDKS